MKTNRQKIKELTELNDALKERRTELLKRIESLENTIRMIEKSRDEVCDENHRLMAIVEEEWSRQFKYGIFVCKKDNNVMFWNDGRFEYCFTNIDFSSSLDTVPVIDVTYR